MPETLLMFPVPPATSASGLPMSQVHADRVAVTMAVAEYRSSANY
jgi:hypothetical protein